MHREIHTDDVSEFSSETDTEDIETDTSEDIQYRNGRLEKSSGSTFFNLVDDDPSDVVDDSFSLSRALSVSGTYNMDVIICQALDEKLYSEQRQKLFSEISYNSKEEGLKPNIDERKKAWFYEGAS